MREMRQVFSISNDAEYRDALERKLRLIDEIDGRRRTVEGHGSTPEDREDLRVAEEELRRVDLAIRQWEDHVNPQPAPRQDEQRQQLPATPATDQQTPEYTQGETSMFRRSRMYRWIKNILAVLGLALILFLAVFAWPVPQLQRWWQNDIEPILPCLIVEQGDYCPVRERDNSDPESTSPDSSGYSPPSRSEARWICDIKSYAGETSDGNPTYGSCVDP